MPVGSDRWAAIERLYHAAVAQPVDRRAAFVADACGQDDELRREVASLLANGGRTPPGSPAGLLLPQPDW